MIKIFIVDDQQLIIEAWTNLLNSYEEFSVVSHAMNEKDAIEGCLVYRPDVVLLDINLKGASGIDVCEDITNQLPKTKVIGLSLHDKVAIVQKIISKGAKGYVTKNVMKEELVEAIKAVYDGQTYICKEMQDKFVQQMMFKDGEDDGTKELTIKEIEILQLIARGLTSKEIADEIFVSPRTIETHRHNILKKLDLPNTARLISWAVQNGYLD
jgi:two-component system invasion response regulator UvrY